MAKDGGFLDARSVIGTEFDEYAGRSGSCRHKEWMVIEGQRPSIDGQGWSKISSMPSVDGQKWLGCPKGWSRMAWKMAKDGGSLEAGSVTGIEFDEYAGRSGWSRMVKDGDRHPGFPKFGVRCDAKKAGKSLVRMANHHPG